MSQASWAHDDLELKMQIGYWQDALAKAETEEDKAFYAKWITDYKEELERRYASREEIEPRGTHGNDESDGHSCQ